MKEKLNKIIDAFETRKPWAVFLLALLQGPFVGYIYCNKGVYACSYFLVLFFASFCSSLGRFISALYLVFYIITALHCYIIAKIDKIEKPLKWYARGYGVVLAMIIVNVTMYIMYIIPLIILAIASP